MAQKKFRYGEKIISHYDLTNIQGTRLLLQTSLKTAQYFEIVTLKRRKINADKNQKCCKYETQNFVGPSVQRPKCNKIEMAVATI